jgi:prepilin-type N-terminal cleavage/methylation domain-containing protein
MIKNLKDAFSLAELLITLAIIAIIATMGYTISKTGIDNAYNAYLYNGYVSLSNAIAEASYNGKHATATAGDEFDQYLLSLFSGTIVESSNTYKFKTTNNVQYELERAGQISNSGTGNTKPLIKITMTYPQANNQTASLTMYYSEFLIHGALVPTDPYQTISDKTLLAFYLDDGKAGRIINGTYHKRTFYSAKEAFCQAYAPLRVTMSDGNTKTILACNGNNIPNTATEPNSVVVPINPKKI